MSNEKPALLGVNIRCDISGPLLQGLEKCGCRMSIYIRPDDREHPRMRPERLLWKRGFDIVVFDTGQPSGNFSDEDLVGARIVPEWFEGDVLNALRDPAVVVLSPANLIQGVRVAFSASVRRRVNLFREREPSLWRQGGIHPAQDVLRLWSAARASGFWADRFAAPD